MQTKATSFVVSRSTGQGWYTKGSYSTQEEAENAIKDLLMTPDVQVQARLETVTVITQITKKVMLYAKAYPICTNGEGKEIDQAELSR